MERANKYIEYKGVNNRLLRDIGWVEVVNGNRDSPRNSDVALRSSDELLQTRKELLSLQRMQQDLFVRYSVVTIVFGWIDVRKLL